MFPSTCFRRQLHTLSIKEFSESETINALYLGNRAPAVTMFIPVKSETLVYNTNGLVYELFAKNYKNTYLKLLF